MTYVMNCNGSIFPIHSQLKKKYFSNYIFAQIFYNSSSCELFDSLVLSERNIFVVHTRTSLVSQRLELAMAYFISVTWLYMIYIMNEITLSVSMSLK